VKAWISNNNEAKVTIFTIGDSPLHYVTIEYFDGDLIDERRHNIQVEIQRGHSPKSTVDDIMAGDAHVTLATIPVLTKASGVEVVTLSLGEGKARNFSFNFFAMNGVWSEVLHFRRVGRWVQGIKSN
jgi:hypothetical protein